MFLFCWVQSGLPIEIYVLVFLGRILGVLHRAIRPPAEPVGVLPDVGMIRRALQGDIHGDFDAVLGPVVIVTLEREFAGDRGAAAIRRTGTGGDDLIKAGAGRDTLVGQAGPLPIDVSVVAMTDDLAVGKLDLAC